MSAKRRLTGRVVGPFAALVLALAACGGHSPSDGPGPARSALPGQAGRDCRYASDPEATPTLRQLSRAGTVGNISLWGRQLDPADTVELSIRYAGDGRIAWVRAFRSTVAPEQTAALEDLLLEAVEGTATPDWGVRVLVAGGDVVRTAPSVLCEPERVAGGSIGSMGPGSTGAAYGDFHPLQGRRFPVRVTLDERGRVMDIDLLRSSYNRWVDRQIIDYLRASTFDPKLHDGFGVATTFQLDVRIPRR